MEGDKQGVCERVSSNLGIDRPMGASGTTKGGGRPSPPAKTTPAPFIRVRTRSGIHSSASSPVPSLACVGIPPLLLLLLPLLPLVLLAPPFPRLLLRLLRRPLRLRLHLLLLLVPQPSSTPPPLLLLPVVLLLKGRRRPRSTRVWPRRFLWVVGPCDGVAVSLTSPY